MFFPLNGINLGQYQFLYFGKIDTEPMRARYLMHDRIAVCAIYIARIYTIHVLNTEHAYKYTDWKRLHFSQALWRNIQKHKMLCIN